MAGEPSAAWAALRMVEASVPLDDIENSIATGNTLDRSFPSMSLNAETGLHYANGTPIHLSDIKYICPAAPLAHSQPPLKDKTR